MNVILSAFFVFLVAFSNGQILQDMNVTVQPIGHSCNAHIIENLVYSFDGTSDLMKRVISHTFSSFKGVVSDTISISVVGNENHNATLDSFISRISSFEITWLVTPTPEADQVLHFELSYEVEGVVRTVSSRNNNGPDGKDINARNTHGVIWDATAGDKRPTSLQYVFLFETNLTSSDQSDVQTDQYGTTSPIINSHSVTWTTATPYETWNSFTVLFPWTDGPSNCTAYPENNSSTGDSNDGEYMKTVVWMAIIFALILFLGVPIVIVLLCVCGIVGVVATSTHKPKANKHGEMQPLQLHSHVFPN